MKLATALPVLAALALTSPALAQDAPPPDAGFAKHHTEMCANHYARAAGKLTEIEIRLALTASQKTAFERWKDAKLADAKAASAHCADFKPLGRDASIMERRDRQIAELQARLDTLKSERPALAALVKVLSPEQQDVLKRAAGEVRGDRMMMMHRFGNGIGNGPHRMDPPPMQ